jgi:HSP20 family protein
MAERSGFAPERDIFETMRELMRWPFDEGLMGDAYAPQIDVSETDGERVIRAEMPGLNPEDVDISLQNGNLVLKGEKKRENEDQGENYYHVERSYGSFYRSVPVPEDITENDVKASFKNGVLTVRVPKGESSSGKRIPIDVEG